MRLNLLRRAPSTAQQPEPGLQPRARGGLGAELSHLLAWCWIMALNALWIDVALPWPHTFRTAITHHGYDAAQVALLAVTAALLQASSAKVRQLLRLPEWTRYLGLFVFGWVVARLTFGDVHGFIERQLPSPHAPYWFPLLTMLGGLSLAAALGLGKLFNRPYLRIVALVGSSCVILMNQSVLIYEYAGPHLFAAVASALLLGVAYSGLELPSNGIGRLERLRRWLLPLAALCSALALTTTPRPAVAMRLFQTPGAVLSPFVVEGRLKRSIQRASRVDERYTAWLEPREGRPEVPPGPALLPPGDLIVVLLTVDSFRADLIGDQRYTQVLSELEAMRQQALNFTQARSIAAATQPSISGMFAGLYPLQLHEYRKKDGKGELRSYRDAPYLALPDTEIETVQLYAHAGVGKGYALGFKRALVPKGTLGKGIIDVLEQHRRGPLFVYAHFMEPHHPYGEEGKSGNAVYRGYVRAVARFDRQLAEIREYLRDSEKIGQTVLIVSADHGEAFGEHGLNYHSKTVYDEMIRVPLLIEAPGVTPREVSTPVSTVDLAPTVRDLFGLPTAGELMGQSLAAALRGEELSLERALVSQTTGGIISALIFPDGFKAIYDRKRQLAELYDLRVDPGEKNNLLEDPATSLHLGTLVAFVKAHRRINNLPPKQDTLGKR